MAACRLSRLFVVGPLGAGDRTYVICLRIRAVDRLNPTPLAVIQAGLHIASTPSECGNIFPSGRRTGKAAQA